MGVVNRVSAVNPTIQKDDIDIVINVKKINFEGGVTVVDDGGSKVTVTVTGGENFSFEKVTAMTAPAVIPIDQHMIVKNSFIIDESITLLGSLVII